MPAQSKTIGQIAPDRAALTAKASNALKSDVLSLLTSRPTDAALSLEFRDLRSIHSAFESQFADIARGVHPADNCCCCCPCCCCSAASVTNPMRGL